MCDQCSMKFPTDIIVRNFSTVRLLSSSMSSKLSMLRPLGHSQDMGLHPKMAGKKSFPSSVLPFPHSQVVGFSPQIIMISPICSLTFPKLNPGLIKGFWAKVSPKERSRIGSSSVVNIFIIQNDDQF
uniref:Uncharacterized protein n=1 Tax=Lepeophtheirus salmonis TaxID=72036 RepID=A0A0K2T753_LEPSM